MARSALFKTLVMLGLAAQPAFAAEVKLNYTGVVTQANGAQASLFAPGQAINLTYSLETTAADSNATTSAGVYLNGMRALAFSVSDAGASATAGSGIVQTFNDVVGSDQVFIYGSATGGSLGGLPVTWAEVDFVDRETGADGEVLLLANDGIPTSHLIANESFLIFTTRAGSTYVHFLAEPAKAIATCASEGYTGTKLTWCQNICEKGYTGGTLNMWIRRWIDRYRILPACAAPEPEN